jgi:hypothetical protein
MTMKTGATVTAKDGSENFTGSVEVTFTVATPVEKTDLSWQLSLIQN